jgi:spore germination cell wall hydrolase CwlJ-like protein/DNA-directed RNA polymerase subunit RPC12/RpoP
MNTYICTHCGRRSYSAADRERLTGQGCPYCGGRIAPAARRDKRTSPDMFIIAVGITAIILAALVIFTLSFIVGSAAGGETIGTTPGTAVRNMPPEDLEAPYEENAPVTGLVLTAAESATEITGEDQSDKSTEPCYQLTDEERFLVERVVMAEAGGEPYDGQLLVAQCILNACLKDGIRPDEAVEVYQYSANRPKPTDSVKKAVAAVFDQGETVTEEPILYFYAPAWCTSKWHESQIFVLEYGGHRFFKEG